MKSDETIVYLDGGEHYFGRFSDIPLKDWILFGIDRNQNYLYKGYRHFDNKTDSVVVFTKERLRPDEIDKRRRNGFLGIREYVLR